MLVSASVLHGNKGCRGHVGLGVELRGCQILDLALKRIPVQPLQNGPPSSRFQGSLYKPHTVLGFEGENYAVNLIRTNTVDSFFLQALTGCRWHCISGVDTTLPPNRSFIFFAKPHDIIKCCRKVRTDIQVQI